MRWVLLLMLMAVVAVPCRGQYLGASKDYMMGTMKGRGCDLVSNSDTMVKYLCDGNLVIHGFHNGHCNSIIHVYPINILNQMIKDFDNQYVRDPQGKNELIWTDYERGMTIGIVESIEDGNFWVILLFSERLKP